MDEKKYIRGSEWRKWDLHIHTPKSIIQHYGGDTPEAWEKFITQLESLPPEYKAIGINDYIFIDGYRKVLEYKDKGRLSNIDLILPVIELRVDKFSSIGDEAWKKINLHVIFSNEWTPDIIEAQFLNAIQHSIKISPDIEGIDFKGVATREALEEIGKRIKQSSKIAIDWPDLKVGFWNINFDYKTVKDITHGFFKGTCLTAVGKSEWDTMRWDGSAALKKTIINEADFSFIALEKADNYDKHTKALSDQNVRSILLDCSDAHYFAESQEKDRIGNSFTWLKADTTFSGLKQVANDRSRIFIGDKPPLLKRFEANKTKFIRSLTVNKVGNSALHETWFDGLELPFNHSMVAIIGNKGNGKSAISDTIGLVGNTPNYEFFSFLRNEKFRRKKPMNKSEQFEAIITWEDGSEDKRRLNINPEASSLEKVKYIPQGFLERLCNEDVEDFESELRKVIFSHISETDRLGMTNLDELIEYKTEIVNGEVEDLKKEVNSINKVIIEMERKQSSEYKRIIEEKLKEKENILTAHDALKPIPIAPPTDNAIIVLNKETTEAINVKRETLIKVQEQITSNQKQLKEIKYDVSKLEKTEQAINAFENQYKKLKSDLAPVFQAYSITSDDTILLKTDTSRIQSLVNEKQIQITTLENELYNGAEHGLVESTMTLEDEIKALHEQLDKHSREYQQYLDDQKAWEDKRKDLVGETDKDDSISFYKEHLKYLTERLAADIQAKYDERTEIVKQLFRKKAEVISLYKSFFRPVTSFITQYGELLKSYSINLDVDYKISGFTEKFFDHISLGAKGSFLGNPAGIERLHQILESHEMKTEDDVVAFLDELISNLRFDHRDGFPNESREIHNQLKKGYSVSDLYAFLFNLDYLEPEYKLKLGDKNISELSPGERGALLLIFYLTLDQNDCPLIIDQPEENLDNQSVFKILVQFIKDAKEKRQIIIVTHNPNLAVACHAEQIVHVSIDKMNLNKVDFASGALENAKINDAVIDILEGTFPALNTRTAAYKIIERRR
jgi:hypothetical protein